MCASKANGGRRCSCPPVRRSSLRRAVYAVDRITNQTGTRVLEAEAVEPRTVEQILDDAGITEK